MKHVPLQLRPYQRKNADEILACLERGVCGVLYVLPTAGGKTVVVVGGVIRTVVDHGWPTVFLVHRRELLQQSLRQLAAVGIDAAIVDPDHDPDPTALVHVCSIDTLKARKGRLADWLRTIRLVVVDEAHHTVAPGWQALLEAMPQAQRLGVTATPFRGDGKPLGDLFEVVVRGPSVAELTAAGFLCPAEVWSPYSPDLSGVKVSRGDFSAGDLDRVMNNDKITKLAINAYSARMPLEPAIAFCSSIDHARRVAELFSAAGYLSLSVDGDMDPTERDAAISGLAAGRIQVLTSCMIISEGTDIPVVAGAIFLRPTKSAQLYMQQSGRVLRINPGKKRACIIDLADNVKLHGMPEADRTWSLQHGLIPNQHRTVRCPECHRRFAPAPCCPGCRRTFQAPSVPTVVRSLDQLTDSAMRAWPTQELENMARTEADLKRIARVKDFAPGWLFHAKQRLSARLAKQYEMRRYA
ncbi:DEAD/DEAH box helicase [Azospirillum sp. B506]|uniref:DEAD/DEAH box helicase n=1 Tax=Azospirillum sp. B506 TaxID=137721 RepID=UPI00034DF07D|nr:DEAD/DEAH box helicase [Azospirillum sp. B506]